MSGLPKYQSIANDLRARIATDEFAPGERLPSQPSLAAEYAVTIMTLRQAVAALEAEGLVRAVKGTGTFVSESSSVRYDLDHLRSFTQEMTGQGIDVTTEVLAAGPVVDSVVSDALGLDDDVGLVRIDRLRRVDHVPVVLQRSTLPASLWADIATVDLAAASLYDALAERCDLVVERATEVIRAVNLSAPDARHLEARRGAAALESTRVSHAADGTAFLHDRALLRGDTEIRTERSASGASVAFQAN